MTGISQSVKITEFQDMMSQAQHDESGAIQISGEKPTCSETFFGEKTICKRPWMMTQENYILVTCSHLVILRE